MFVPHRKHIELHGLLLGSFTFFFLILSERILCTFCKAVMSAAAPRVYCPLMRLVVTAIGPRTLLCLWDNEMLALVLAQHIPLIFHCDATDADWEWLGMQVHQRVPSQGVPCPSLARHFHLTGRGNRIHLTRRMVTAYTIAWRTQQHCSVGKRKQVAWWFVRCLYTSLITRR
jgi:hypothetical protein